MTPVLAMLAPMRRALAITLALAVALSFAAATTTASAPPAGGGVGWHPALASAERYARARSGEISFAVIGLDGHMRQFHPGQTAPAASVFKVMLLATYL